ncbi:hypothetical protein BH18ACI2_BH18ACI2_19400 [soil metagenome]
MPNVFRDKTFIAGFFCCLFLFVVANGYSYSLIDESSCFDCFFEFGFPFHLGQYGGFFTVHRFLLGGLIADALIAIFTSTAIGLVCSRLFGTLR